MNRPGGGECGCVEGVEGGPAPLPLAVPSDVPQAEHILAIEVSNPSAAGAPEGTSAGAASGGGGPGVALARREPGPGGGTVTVVAAEAVRAGGRGGLDDDLIPAIDRLFRRAGLGPRGCNLSRVGVSVGPGGYTSVRVACAAGKMIAEACGARGVSVPTARVVLEGVPGGLRGAGPVAVLLAGKGPTAWAEVYEPGGAAGPGRLVSAADAPGLLAMGVRTVVGDRFVPPDLRAALEAGGAGFLEPVFSAAACVVLAAGMAGGDPVLVVPVYPREPDAVTLWRARKGG